MKRNAILVHTFFVPVCLSGALFFQNLQRIPAKRESVWSFDLERSFRRIPNLSRLSQMAEKV